MSEDPTKLLEELRSDVKDKRRGALLDAYVAKPSADSIVTKSLELLKEEIDAIDKH